MSKYVLTGGPSVGKTSVIKNLERKNYIVEHEVAREMIGERKKSGKEWPIPKGDQNEFLEFQKNVLKRQLQLESGFNDNNSRIIFDRGLADSLAYCRAFEYTPNDEIMNAARSMKYNAVFLLDILPPHIYNKDKARHENYKTSQKIHSIIKTTYMEFGQKVIDVPAFFLGEEEHQYLESVNKRTDFILEKIK